MPSCNLPLSLPNPVAMRWEAWTRSVAPFVVVGPWAHKFKKPKLIPQRRGVGLCAVLSPSWGGGGVSPHTGESQSTFFLSIRPSALCASLTADFSFQSQGNEKSVEAFK